MKIRDIIFEGPLDTIKSVAATANQARSDFNQGYKKMDKILSPDQWGKDDTPAAKLVPHTAKQMLTRASTGQKLYNEDLKIIASLRSALAAGSLKTSQDTQALDLALETLAKSRVVDKAQAAMLAALAKEL